MYDKRRKSSGHSIEALLSRWGNDVVIVTELCDHSEGMLGKVFIVFCVLKDPVSPRSEEHTSEPQSP